ncbi:MAG TPA: hypothetical protein VGF28_00370 [Thermoanaerobaculia bacterium]|jgi:hypothetical protein
MADVTILLEDTAISGVGRVALIHADRLVADGHRVRIVTTGEPVTWRASRAEWVYADHLPSDGIPAATLPLVVEEELFRDRTPREHEPLRVLLCGASQDETLALADGYGAVAHARWFHQTLDVVRVSPWAPSREEPLESVQEFHVALTAAEMTRLMHSCDVLVAPGPRFALTTAEALAAGLACVIAAPPFDYPAAAPVDNPVELGERLIEVLSDAALRSKVRMHGREVAERWRGVRLELG